MNTLQTFSFETKDIRVLGTPNEPLFIATDICNALGLENARQAVGRLEADEYNTVTISDGNPGNPEVNAVNEAGLYRLVLESRKPEAKAFKRWLLHEVLPAIRKYGAYATDGEFRALHHALLRKKELLEQQEQLRQDVRALDKEIKQLQFQITKQPALLPSGQEYKDELVSKELAITAYNRGETQELFRGARNWKSIKRWYAKLQNGEQP